MKKYVLIIGNGLFQKYIAIRLLEFYPPESLIIENSQPRKKDNIRLLKEIFLYGGIRNIYNHFYNDLQIKKYIKNYNNELKKLLKTEENITYKNIYKTNNINSNEVIKFLKQFNFDVIICIGTSIIKSDILNIYKNKIFNLHTSILPKYRGVLAEFWALYYNDYKNIGVSLHHLKRKLDSGDIVAQQKTEYNSGDTPAKLRFKNAVNAIEVVKKFIDLDNYRNIKPNNSRDYYSKPTYVDIKCMNKKEKEYLKSYDISLKKYPYLFRAAATITNDIDEENFEDFIEIMKYFNTSNLTKIGRGLNLEIGNSFWFYHNKKKYNQEFSYFNGLTQNYSKYQPIILKLLKSGHIDCLHSYGNFNEVGGFNLKLAEYVANEELIKHNIKIKVWIDHGDNYNYQNYKNFLKNGQPKEFDHYDYFKSMGIEFMWYGNTRITDIVGQDRKVSFFEPYINFSLGKYSKQNLIKRFLKNIISNVQKISKINLFDYIFDGNNDSIKKITLHNGYSVYIFRRFGSWEDDHPQNLPNIINEYILNKLVEVEGVSFFYTHLGKRKVFSKTLFLPETIKCFELLKRYNEENKIFITTTSRLLNYIKIRKQLKFKSYWKNGCIYIEILNSNISEDDLQGISFYTPYPFKTFVIFKNKKLEVEKNSADHKGKKSITIKWNKLIFPIIGDTP